MDGGLSPHIKHYSSSSFTSAVSSGMYSPSKSFTFLYVLLILMLISSCTEGNNSTKEEKTQPKISSSLRAVIEELESKTENKNKGLTFAHKSARINEHGEIQIYILLYEIDESKLEDLKKHGLTIDIYNNIQRLVQGWASPSKIRMISELPYVEFIDLPAFGVSN
jgi:hypothetical protein